MRRYIVLLFITGIVWAQTDFDKLVLKDGTTYLGEYSKTEGDVVYFKPQNVFAFQPVPVELIQTLKLKDGHFIIGDGKSILTFEEYQKVNHLIISNKGNKGELIFFCSIITVFFIVIIWKFDGGFSMSGFDLSGHETAW